MATIKSVFPTCRIYREHPRPSAEQLAEDKRDFTNMVIFCTNQASPITFRKPTSKDLLKSEARKMFLLPEHEEMGSYVDIKEDDGGLLMRNDTGRFKGWQEASAKGHWAVMRGVLPKEVWEQW
jgi:hypothetical protein